MSVTYCEGVGWATVLAFWTNDLGEDGLDISVSGGGGLGNLTAVNADMIHNGLAAAITQRHVIGGANAIMGVSADPAVFALPAVPGTMGHTIAAPGLVQQHSLIAVNADMIHNADRAVQGVVILGQNAIQGHTATQVTDIEQQISSTPVTPVSADMIHTVAAPGQTQLHVLTIVNGTMGNVAGG